jgi:hypothetical protein
VGGVVVKLEEKVVDEDLDALWFVSANTYHHFVP